MIEKIKEYVSIEEHPEDKSKLIINMSDEVQLAYRIGKKIYETRKGSTNSNTSGSGEQEQCSSVQANEGQHKSSS